MHRLISILMCGQIALGCSETKERGTASPTATPEPTPASAATPAPAPPPAAPPAPAKPIDVVARLGSGKPVVAGPIVWPAAPGGWTIAVVDDHGMSTQVMAFTGDKMLELGRVDDGTHAITPVGDTLVVQSTRSARDKYGSDAALQVRWDASRARPVPGRRWQCSGQPEPPCSAPAWTTTAQPAPDLRAIGPVPSADEARAAVDAWFRALRKPDLAAAADLWALPWRMELDGEQLEPLTADALKTALQTFIDETGGTLEDLHKAVRQAEFTTEPLFPELAGVGPPAPVLYVMLGAETDDASTYDIGLVVGRFDGRVKVAGATIDAAHGKGH